MRIAGRTSVRATAATVAAGALAAGAFALMSSASASSQSPAGRHGVMGIHVVSHRTAYSFRTVDNTADLTFNQLLGISNQGPLPATGWYLNLHQGNSNTIVANGQPTVNFRPLLCAGL